MAHSKKITKVLRNIFLIILIVLVLNFGATKLIYDSSFGRQDSASSAEPYSLDDVQRLSFMSGTNRLAGYYYPAVDSSTLVVLSTGYTSGAQDYAGVITAFSELGYSVFSFDTTGSNESEGSSSVGFSQELLDLCSALDFVAEQDNFGCTHTVLVGHSRGGYASACVGGFGYNADAVVSISGLNSAMDGVVALSESKIGAVAYLNYPFLWLYQTMLFGSKAVDVRADEVLSDTDVPALVIHGDSDIRVPTDRYSIYSYRSQIENPNAEFLLINGKGHTDILYDDNGSADAQLMSQIDSFIRKNTAD